MIQYSLQMVLILQMAKASPCVVSIETATIEAAPLHNVSSPQVAELIALIHSCSVVKGIK